MKSSLLNSFSNNIFRDSRSYHLNQNRCRLKRKASLNLVHNPKKRRTENNKEDELIDEICDRINFVPFPQQPKTNGVIIEEISEEDINENLEIVRSQTTEVCPDKIIFSPELIRYLKNYPLEFLWKINENCNEKAMVLYKPIQDICPGNTESEEDTKINTIQSLQQNNQISTIDVMEYEDIEME